MANLRVKNGFCEGQSTSGPPYFDGTNYTYWKARMKIYLQSIDYELWLNVSKGPYIPINVFNASLCCALSSDEFNRVSRCCLTYEIWKTLELTQ